MWAAQLFFYSLNIWMMNKLINAQCKNVNKFSSKEHNKDSDNFLK